MRGDVVTTTDGEKGADRREPAEPHEPASEVAVAGFGGEDGDPERRPGRIDAAVDTPSGASEHGATVVALVVRIGLPFGADSP